MTQWIADYYSVVDQLDIDALGAASSPDIKVTFGNNPTTEGFDALAANLGGLWGMLDSMSHNAVRLWEIPGTGWGGIEAMIEYVRKDGVVVNIPNMSTIHRDADGKVDVLNAYIDMTPLFS